MSAHVKEVSDRFKRKDRTELHLSEWRKDRYYLRDGFLDQWIAQDKILSKTLNVEEININDVSVEEFMERFEIPSLPCIINGVTNDWSAKKNWTMDKLY